MALQPKIIACGKTSAAMSIVARCLVGPAVIGVTSIVIGIRGVLLRVAIVQVNKTHLQIPQINQGGLIQWVE